MEIVKDIIKPCADGNRKTCIQVDRQDGQVKYIELDIDTGLEVRETSTQHFDQRFKPLVNYPPDRACKLYAEYSRSLGATPDALTYLRAFTTISDEDYDMATKRKPAAAAAAAAKKAVTAKPAAAQPAKKATAKPAKAAKAPAAKKPAGERDTPAKMFRELIMRGTMTDDAIFAKVQDKFGLDDSKRSYVSWYRNSLRKAGEKVPEPKK